MRLCLPIDLDAAEGGGYQFLRLFRSHLRAQGWTVSADPGEPCDVLFTNHWMVGMDVLLRAMRASPRLRLVQRIDGAAADYGRTDDADQRQSRVNTLADLTIFQSAYCRHSTREKFPVIGQDGPVIHNPVDLSTFTPGPRQPLCDGTRIACVTWSPNPMKGAADIYRVAQAYSHLRFVLCGRYDDAPDLPNLVRCGTLGRTELAATLRSCHALLTFSRNEACPNHVLEALASGLPVLYHDSGAAAEVVGDAGLAVTPDTFASALEQIMAERDGWSQRARARAETMFAPDDVFRRYMEEIAAAMRRPLRVPVSRRLPRAWANLAVRAARRAAKRARGLAGGLLHERSP